MSGWLHGITWGRKGLGIICIWYDMEKASRSPGSVVPRNVYYLFEQRRKLTCQKSAMDEALNMTSKLKRPSKSGLINGFEQGPNGIPNEKKGRV